MKRRWSDTVTENLSYKLVSLFIALILWLTILGRRDFSLSKSIDVELMVGNGYAVAGQSTETVKVKVSGPRTALKKFMDSGLSQLVTLDLTQKIEGEYSIEIPVKQIDVPFGVKVISVRPSVVTARVVKKER